MSKDIIFYNVSKSYKGEKILENFSLKIPEGKFFALLGPSGCGKSTVLEIIGGFEKIDKGELYLGEEDITYVPANKRRIHTVFQDYALFEHFNVFENIAYSLRIKKLAYIDIKREVESTAEIFGITKYLYKNISELSGGEKQRVALARAIINKPDVLLLDEPISALDYKLREKMLEELSDIQDKLGMTFVYVTHDQFEALAVADYMAIMNGSGEIEQIGTPKEIYEKPCSKFVAQFIGTTNIFEGKIKKIEKNLYNFIINPTESFSIIINKEYKEETDGYISIRPERFFIQRKEESIKKEELINRLNGKVLAIIYYGHSTEYTIETQLGNIKILEKSHSKNEDLKKVNYDDEIEVYWYSNDVVFLEK